MTEKEESGPFRDFPDYHGWFFSEKVMAWKKKNQATIERAFTDRQLLNEFPIPPVIFLTNNIIDFPVELKNWYLTDFTKWFEKYRARTGVGEHEQTK